MSRVIEKAAEMQDGWPTWVIAALTASLSALGAIFIGMLVHLRERVKIAADADKTEAEAKDIHWQRFEREIDRLAKRVETLETEVRECHRDKRAVEIELAQFRLAMIDRGNNRQTAQLVISEMRAEARAEGREAGADGGRSGKRGPAAAAGPDAKPTP